VLISVSYKSDEFETLKLCEERLCPTDTGFDVFSLTRSGLLFL